MYPYLINDIIYSFTMEVTATATPTVITLHIEYPRRADLSYNFKLTVVLLTQELPSLSYVQHSHQTHLIPKTTLLLQVTPNQMYKIQCECKFDVNVLTKNIFVFAPEQSEPRPREQRDPRANIREYFEMYNEEGYEAEELCSSEAFLLEVGQERGVGRTNQMQKYILEARKCRNIDQFLNRNQKRVKRERYNKKQDLVLNGMIVFDQVYKRAPGKQFFKNDWHMGPFYSYNANQNNMKK